MLIEPMNPDKEWYFWQTSNLIQDNGGNKTNFAWQCENGNEANHPLCRQKDIWQQGNHYVSHEWMYLV